MTSNSLQPAGASSSYLAAGGSTSPKHRCANILRLHLGALDGSSARNLQYFTLTFGTQTLQPTSPIATLTVNFSWRWSDDSSVCMDAHVIGADHSYGAGGLSSLTDIAVDVTGEIARLLAIYYGEISFSNSGGRVQDIIYVQHQFRLSIKKDS